MTDLRWTLVVPLRALPSAKSRLARTMPVDGPAAHAELVDAIRRDTLRAARACPAVARVLVVADEPLDVADADVLVVQHTAGLNGALRDAEGEARSRWPDDGVAALVGDLPGLRPDDLATALRAAGAHPRAFVPDSSGSGTTLLAARPGTPLHPHYGAGSAAAHGRIATTVDAAPGVRHDIDTFDDLRAARAAEGVVLGPATREVVDRLAAQAGTRRRSS